VGNQYNIIQNRECFSFFDGLVEQGYAKFTKAYSIKNGAIVNVVADLGDIDIGGDACKKQLILRAAHDGSCAVTVLMRVWRLVCSNGLMGWANKNRVKIRHTRNYNIQMKQAREIMGIADQYYTWFAAEAEKLFNAKLYSNEALDYIKKILPAENEEEISTRLQNQRDTVYSRFVYGLGNHGETKWDLYNGVTEFVDHYRTKNSEKSIESGLVGSGAKLKERAFQVLTA